MMEPRIGETHAAFVRRFLASGRRATVGDLVRLTGAGKATIRYTLMRLQAEGRAEVVAQRPPPLGRKGYPPSDIWAACNKAPPPALQALPVHTRALMARTPLECAWYAGRAST